MLSVTLQHPNWNGGAAPLYMGKEPLEGLAAGVFRCHHDLDGTLPSDRHAICHLGKAKQSLHLLL